MEISQEIDWKFPVPGKFVTPENWTLYAYVFFCVWELYCRILNFRFKDSLNIKLNCVKQNFNLFFWMNFFSEDFSLIFVLVFFRVGVVINLHWLFFLFYILYFLKPTIWFKNRHPCTKSPVYYHTIENKTSFSALSFNKIVFF